LIEISHRFVEASQRRVEVRAGLLKRRVSEHVLHVVHGPTGLEQARAAFVPEVVEVQVNPFLGALCRWCGRSSLGRGARTLFGGKVLDGRNDADAVLAVDRRFPVGPHVQAVLGVSPAFAISHGILKFSSK
jgi:hypothetical protein